jgi:hypothetical protein
MDDLKLCSLEELIERVIRERLIDACERQGDQIVIVQGPMRFVLNPIRAHAFLRGVIKGMSAVYRRCSWLDDDEAAGAPANEFFETGIPGTGLLDSFRKHLLKKWAIRYDKAGRPFGQSGLGLMIWIKHGNETTVN